ncbi:uncharacterized protein ATC70_002884 [Mucor velutinosus]|uniref:PAN2-PAN3 deadenylation complex subunit PAN3 n=1 Tax=Mucor velutinosus TaxID=708070 RepID=A0AAN7DE89_9FUNG|nr:hypothetical protein ATC70_002884 [Mucor velutinosus]
MNPYQPSNPITQTSSGISIKSPSSSSLSENQDTTVTKPAPKTIPSSSSSSSSSSKRTCRNVIIHGFCKFQDKGCEFNHDTEKPIVLPQQLVNHSTSPETSRTSSVSAGSIHAPVFVPKSTAIQEKVSPPRPILTDMYNSTDNANARLTSPIQQLPHNRFPFVNGQQYMYPPPSHPSTPLMPHDPYFYMNNHSFPQPSQPQYHQYAPTLPHVANLQNHQRLVQSFYIPDNLREQLLKRNDATIATASAKETGLPEEVHVYHSLYRMEDKPGKVLGHASWVYRAVCRTNGKYYTMVRIEGFRLVNEQAMSIVKQWRKIKHATIVSIREAFTTRAFGDSSLVFVYDYHPCSITLFEAYFSPQAQALLHARFQAAGINGMPVPETTLWSFITQIASALKTIHGAGLSARTIEPTKIIMTSKNRLRISCTGLVDVLQFDTTTQAQRAMHQQEDLLSFGKLVVSLACNSPAVASAMSSFEYMSRFYSPDLKNVAYYLLGKPSLSKSIDEVFTLIGPRLLHELNSSHHYTDTLEANLSNELENSRLVKLMSKLNFINERPEFEKDPRWQESGDRYMIKLFRDYIFHQVNEMGVPVVDMGHVISCMNKLDAGVDESILLTCRDNQTSIIVTYKELKSCIASAFNEINTKAHSTHSTSSSAAVNKQR